jgi:translation initiation factor 2 subunit 2
MPQTEAEYRKLLDKLYRELPEKAKVRKRFEMPRFDSFVQGNQTIINNFTDVASALRREPKHLMKFLTKESATAGTLQKNRLILQGKFRDRLLNERLEIYVKEYVLCRECKKPDTKLAVVQGVQHLVCEACGARSPVRVLK